MAWKFAENRGAVDAIWKTSFGAIDANWKTSLGAIDAKWKTSSGAVDANWKTSSGAIYAISVTLVMRFWAIFGNLKGLKWPQKKMKICFRISTKQAITYQK